MAPRGERRTVRSFRADHCHQLLLRGALESGCEEAARSHTYVGDVTLLGGLTQQGHPSNSSGSRSSSSLVAAQMVLGMQHTARCSHYQARTVLPAIAILPPCLDLSQRDAQLTHERIWGGVVGQAVLQAAHDSLYGMQLILSLWQPHANERLELRALHARSPCVKAQFGAHEAPKLFWADHKLWPKVLFDQLVQIGLLSSHDNHGRQVRRGRITAHDQSLAHQALHFLLARCGHSYTAAACTATSANAHAAVWANQSGSLIHGSDGTTKDMFMTVMWLSVRNVCRDSHQRRCWVHCRANSGGELCARCDLHTNSATIRQLLQHLINRWVSAQGCTVIAHGRSRNSKCSAAAVSP